ncbi:glycosyltransferase family 10 domain-containing protein [Vibrio mediterranei]
MKVSLVIDYHLNNAIFDLNNKVVNRDNYAYSMWLLKKKFEDAGVDLSTCDINSPDESDAVLYFDLPNTEVQHSNKPTYLFLFESEVIKPNSWDLQKHAGFNRVFTWNDSLVDNKRYFKFNYSHLFPSREQIEALKSIRYENRKLCTLISANKNVDHPFELYSERVSAIRWFETNAPKDFDLYGIGWDRYLTNNKYVRYLLSKLPWLEKALATEFPSYKGVVESKYKTLLNYRFAICYENAQQLPGYITEKIFDCFFSGCVPIYWGAPNIDEHIPKNCFIDRRDFGSYEELYSYLKSMTEAEYVSIQENILTYLSSEDSSPYHAEQFADVIVQSIVRDIEKKW